MKKNRGAAANRAYETRRGQKEPKAGAAYSPRGLYRSLTVPLSFAPGKKRIHPKRKPS